MRDGAHLVRHFGSMARIVMTGRLISPDSNSLRCPLPTKKTAEGCLRDTLRRIAEAKTLAPGHAAGPASGYIDPTALPGRAYKQRVLRCPTVPPRLWQPWRRAPATAGPPRRSFAALPTSAASRPRQ